jgi:hypothetical protein
MLKPRACLVAVGVLTFLAPAGFAADYGTGGGVGAEAPDLAPLPSAPKREQATPAPPAEDTGTAPDKTTGVQNDPPVTPPAEQPK